MIEKMAKDDDTFELLDKLMCELSATYKYIQPDRVAGLLVECSTSRKVDRKIEEMKILANNDERGKDEKVAARTQQKIGEIMLTALKGSRTLFGTIRITLTKLPFQSPATPSRRTTAASVATTPRPSPVWSSSLTRSSGATTDLAVAPAIPPQSISTSGLVDAVERATTGWLGCISCTRVVVSCRTTLMRWPSSSFPKTMRAWTSASCTLFHPGKTTRVVPCSTLGKRRESHLIPPWENDASRALFHPGKTTRVAPYSTLGKRPRAAPPPLAQSGR